MISERTKRVSSVMFVFNQDFRYIRIYIYIYICGRTSSYIRMLNSSLLGNEKLRGPVVCTMWEELNFYHFLKHSNHLK